MAILKLSEREKQTANRSDKDFLFELGEIRVAYGEMGLDVMEMMWMSGEQKQAGTPGPPRGTAAILCMWQAIEMLKGTRHT